MQLEPSSIVIPNSVQIKGAKCFLQGDRTLYFVEHDVKQKNLALFEVFVYLLWLSQKSEK